MRRLLERWLIRWADADIREALAEQRKENDRLSAKIQVLEDQNEMLWKLNERNIARIDMERANLLRREAEAKAARAATGIQEAD